VGIGVGVMATRHAREAIASDATLSRRVSAAGTGLGGAGSRDALDHPTGTCGLVGDQAQQLAPARIQDGTVQPSLLGHIAAGTFEGAARRASHRFDVEGFVSDEVEIADQPRRELMREVAPGLADLGVQPRGACFGPVASATFAATRLGAGRKRALRCRELVLAGPQLTRMRDQLHATLVIRDGGKDVDTHVDATSPTRWRQWGNLDVAPKHGGFPADAAAAYHQLPCFGAVTEDPMHFDADVPDALDIQPPVAAAVVLVEVPANGVGPLHRIPRTGTAKAREPWTLALTDAAEEMLERIVETH